MHKHINGTNPPICLRCGQGLVLGNLVYQVIGPKHRLTGNRETRWAHHGCWDRNFALERNAYEKTGWVARYGRLSTDVRWLLAPVSS